jgi:hypothetical protein
VAGRPAIYRRAPPLVARLRDVRRDPAFSARGDEVARVVAGVSAEGHGNLIGQRFLEHRQGAHALGVAGRRLHARSTMSPLRFEGRPPPAYISSNTGESA